MIKRGLLTLTFLGALFSGMGMVSAFEAHTINVTAHIENAMGLSSYQIHFGTVFPEEWLVQQRVINVSSSFCDQDQFRVTVIEYDIWVQNKPLPPGHPNYPGLYPWLGDALYIGIVEDAQNTDPAIRFPVGVGSGVLASVDPTGTAPRPILVLSNSLHKFSQANQSWDLSDLLIVGLDVPVFEGFWNSLTDVNPKPSGLSGPTVVIEESDTDRWNPDGVDLGADIVVQITDIHNDPSDGSLCTGA